MNLSLDDPNNLDTHMIQKNEVVDLTKKQLLVR